jgi:hypothetical protein
MSGQGSDKLPDAEVRLAIDSAPASRLRCPAISIAIKAKRTTRVAIRYGGGVVADAVVLALPLPARFRRPVDVRLVPDAFSVDAETPPDSPPSPGDVEVRIAVPVQAETLAERLAGTLWPEPTDSQRYPAVTELRALGRALSEPPNARVSAGS